MSALKPTKEQQKILDSIEAPAHLKIIARAGSAKTTTLVLAAGKTKKPGLALAFNKRIAEELFARLPAHVEAKTLNSFGHHILADALQKRLRVDKNKTGKLLNLYLKSRPKLQDLLGEEYQNILKDISWLKALGYAPNELSLVPDHFLESNLEIRSTARYFDEYLQVVKAVSKLSYSEALQGRIDFDDQILMPVAMGLTPKIRAQNLFVDEAQDMNPCNIWLLRRLAGTGCRLIAAGDPAQAIYQFRGSVSNSFDQIFSGLHVKDLALTTCFRSAAPIIDEARKIVPDINPCKHPPAGRVLSLEEWDAASLHEHHIQTILCRYNAPLVKLGLQLFVEGMYPNLPFFGDMLGYIKKLAGKYSTQKAFDAFATQRIKVSANPAATADTFAAIKNILQACSFNPALVGKFAEKLSNTHSQILLTTIHKAKGLEWKHVGVLDLDNIRDEGGIAGNLRYVAITRAKQTLVYLNSSGFRQRD